jgi:hypothetical protein
MTKERILILAGIGILAVVAVLGWTRQGTTTPQATLLDPSAPTADVPSYADRPSVRAIAPDSAPAYASGPQYGSQPAEPQYYGDRRAEPQYSGDRRAEYSTRVVTRERPLSHSLEIVGGSAAAGAAIGAVAGGGRGAGIGALSGGGAGFIYDRLTHRQRVVVQQ